MESTKKKKKKILAMMVSALEVIKVENPRCNFVTDSANNKQRE